MTPKKNPQHFRYILRDSSEKSRGSVWAHNAQEACNLLDLTPKREKLGFKVYMENPGKAPMLVTGKATPKAPSKPQEPAYRSSLADMPSHMAEAVRLSQERRAAQFLADNLIQLAHKIGCFMQDNNEMR